MSGRATVRANVFSGRPNPEWSISPELLGQLMGRAAELPLAKGQPKQPPGLGFSGFEVHSDRLLFSVFFEDVLVGEAREYRRDSDLFLHQRLKESAPKGELPPGFGI